MYNHNAKGVFPLDPNATELELRVGQQSVIPGAGATSTIKSILISDEIIYGHDTNSWTGRDAATARTVNEPVDPLMDIRPIGDAIRRHEDPGPAIGALRNDVYGYKTKPASFSLAKSGDRQALTYAQVLSRRY